MDNRLTMTGDKGALPRGMMFGKAPAIIGVAGKNAALALGAILRRRLGAVQADLKTLRRFGAMGRYVYAPGSRRITCGPAAAERHIGAGDVGAADLALNGAQLAARSTAFAGRVDGHAMKRPLGLPVSATAIKGGRMALAGPGNGVNLGGPVGDTAIKAGVERKSEGRQHESEPRLAQARPSLGKRVGIERLKVEMMGGDRGKSGLALSGALSGRIATDQHGTPSVFSPGGLSSEAGFAEKPTPRQVRKDLAMSQWHSARALKLRSAIKHQGAFTDLARMQFGRTSDDMPRSAAAPEAVNLRRPLNTPGPLGAPTEMVRGGEAMTQARSGIAAASDSGSGVNTEGDTGAPQQGDVYLDGALMGRWMARSLAREAGRAPSGGAGFDPRRSALPSGRMIGG
jgi:hypothetical protein